MRHEKFPLILIYMVMALMLAGCAASVRQASIESSWNEGAHAQTYVVSRDGTNADCIICHSRAQYFPPLDDLPEGCLKCKYEALAPGPFVALDDWMHVDCQVCHQVGRIRVRPEVALLEFATAEEYSEVGSIEELCLDCHLKAPPEGHASVVVGGTHTGMTCITCHDPHSAQASCTDAGCHDFMLDAQGKIPGHDLTHARVRCAACHDGDGLPVGPTEDQTSWITWLASGEDAPDRPFSSHNLVLEASCDRCHFQDNPWSLTVNLNQEGG